jgi:hypothetical protein
VFRQAQIGPFGAFVANDFGGKETMSAKPGQQDADRAAPIGRKAMEARRGSDCWLLLIRRSPLSSFLRLTTANLRISLPVSAQLPQAIL